jgi:hypothetical protein
MVHEFVKTITLHFDDELSSRMVVANEIDKKKMTI